MDPFLDETRESRSGFDIGQFLRIFWRRKWLFVVPVVICLAVAALAIKVMDPVFVSSAQINVIREGTTARSLPDDTPRYRRSRDEDNETLALIQGIVTSPKFLARLVQDQQLHLSSLAGEHAPAEGAVLTPEEDQRAIDRMVGRLRAWIRVERDDLHLFSIGVRHSNSWAAYRLAQKILESFLEEERATRMQGSTSTREFLEEQRTVYAGNLERAQRALTDFQRSTMSVTLAGNPFNEQNLGRARSLLDALQTRFAGTEAAELASLEQAARMALATGLSDLDPYLGDGEIRGLIDELAGLEYAQVLVSAGARAADPESANELGLRRLALDGRIAILVAGRNRVLGDDDRNRVARWVYASVYRTVNQRVIERLRADIDAQQDFITRQPTRSSNLTRLQQEVEQAQEMLQDLDRDINAETLRLAASMSEIGYRIVVRMDPRLPVSPVEPSKPRLAMLAAALALALGFGLVLLAEVLDRSFKSVEQIESTLGLKVIGALPVVEDGQFPSRRRRRVLLWIVLVVAVLAVAAFGLLWVYPRFS